MSVIKISHPCLAGRSATDFADMFFKKKLRRQGKDIKVCSSFLCVSVSLQEEVSSTFGGITCMANRSPLMLGRKCCVFVNIYYHLYQHSLHHHTRYLLNCLLSKHSYVLNNWSLVGHHFRLNGGMHLVPTCVRWFFCIQILSSHRQEQRCMVNRVGRMPLF